MLVACTSLPAQDAGTSSVVQAVTSNDCVDWRDYGAVPDDGIDDRIAMQAALDAAKAAHKPICRGWTGRYSVTKKPGTGISNVASLVVDGDGMDVGGLGDQSIIEMIGDSGGGDWWVFRVSGANNRLHDFSIEGATRGATTEQTHLIQTWGPAQDNTVESMRLNLPSFGPHTGGDCIRAGGEQATPVIGLTIDKVRGIECDRSLFGGQRWVFGVRILNSSSYSVGDNVVDYEVSGVGHSGDIVIRDCRLRRNGLGNAVALALATSAGGAPPGYDVLVEHTTVDGAISIYNTGYVTLRDVRAVSQGPSPTVDIRKDSAHVKIEGGYYEHFGSTAAPVVNVSYQTSTWPRFVTIAKPAHLVQRTNDHVIKAEPAQSLAVEGADIECLQPQANTFAAIFARATVAPATGISISGPTITGGCKQLLRAAATASFGIGTVKVRDAIAESVAQGLFFENGTPSSRPVADGNTFGLSTVAVVGVGANGFIGVNN